MDNATQNTQTEGQNSSQINGIKSKISKLPAIPVFVGIIMLLVVGYFSYISLNRRVAPSLQRAAVQISKGNYDQAQTEYKNALKINPNDPNAQAGIINTISAVGNQSGTEGNQLKAAQPYIDHALQTNPNNFNVMLSVGYAYEAAGNYNKAVEYYTKSTQINPKSAEAWFHLGHANAFLNNTDEANKDYDKAYSLNPNNPLVLIVRGNKFYSEGKLQEAFDSYKKAAQYSGLVPRVKAEALSSASLIRGEQDNYSHIAESLTLAQQAVEADSNFSPALASYAYALYLNKKTSSAVAYIKNAITVNPRISKNYEYLAIFLRITKDFTGSINNLEKAISIVDNDNTLVTLSDKQKAKALYTYELALSYSMSNSNTDKVKLIQEAITLNPSIKALLKYDFEKRGFFKELSNNSSFLTLVNN